MRFRDGRRILSIGAALISHNEIMMTVLTKNSWFHIVFDNESVAENYYYLLLTNGWIDTNNLEGVTDKYWR